MVEPVMKTEYTGGEAGSAAMWAPKMSRNTLSNLVLSVFNVRYLWDMWKEIWSNPLNIQVWTSGEWIGREMFLVEVSALGNS